MGHDIEKSIYYLEYIKYEGLLVSGASDKTIRIWNIEERTQMKVI